MVGQTDAPLPGRPLVDWSRHSEHQQERMREQLQRIMQPILNERITPFVRNAFSACGDRRPGARGPGPVGRCWGARGAR